MNTLLFGLICCVVVLSAYADEDVKASSADKKESDIKVYKRLIPADVLRGECSIIIYNKNHNKIAFCLIFSLIFIGLGFTRKKKKLKAILYSGHVVSKNCLKHKKKMIKTF